MTISVPGVGVYELETVVLDLNGTLTVRGKLVAGVASRVNKLRKAGFRVVLFSGDTRGTAGAIAKKLKVELVTTATADEKLAELCRLDASTCVAIGNGAIDELMLKAARLGIVTLQAEGIHAKALAAADVIVPSVNDALDMLIDTATLVATLRR